MNSKPLSTCSAVNSASSVDAAINGDRATDAFPIVGALNRLEVALVVVVSPASYAVDMPNGSSELGSLIERHRTAILALVRRHRGCSIAVFGSVAQDEATPDSDIDFLVEFDPSSSLVDLIHLEEALTALLGVAVDVVSSGALLERDVEIRNDAVAL